ncbi:hypothetical protein EIN_276920, partial [Entamoeba invadens IP1]
MFVERFIGRSTFVESELVERGFDYQAVTTVLPHCRTYVEQYFYVYFAFSILFGILDRKIYLAFTATFSVLLLLESQTRALEWCLKKIYPKRMETYLVPFSSECGFLSNSDFLNPMKKTIVIYCRTHPLTRQWLNVVLYVGVVILPFLGLPSKNDLMNVRLFFAAVVFVVSCLADIPRLDQIKQVVPMQFLFELLDKLKVSKIEHNVVVCFVAGDDRNNDILHKVINNFDPALLIETRLTN